MQISARRPSIPFLHTLLPALLVLGSAGCSGGGGGSGSGDSGPARFAPGEGTGLHDPIVVGDSGRIWSIAVDGSGSFSAPVEILPSPNLAYYTRGVAIGDFDKDGIEDFVSGFNGQAHFYKGNGDGSYQPKVALAVTPGAGSYTMDMAAGDWNGDGNLDFIQNTNSTNSGFYFGDGTGGFTLQTRSLGGNGRGTDDGDFNEDGKLDFVRARCCDGRMEFYAGDGTGNFAVTFIASVSGGDPYGLAAADFDNDGHLDVIAGGGGGGDPYFYKGTGSGTFAAGIFVPSADMNNYSAYDAFDFNNDGNADLIGTNYSSRQVRFFPGNGDGTFAASQQIGANLPDNLLGVSAPRLPPLVSFSIDPADQTIVAGGTATFSAVGPAVAGATAIDWTFGDGGTASGSSVTHVYPIENVYTAQVVLTAADGIKHRRKARVQVNGAGPSSNPGGPYVFGESSANQDKWTATLNGSASSDDVGIVSYSWNFGDGTAAGTGPTPTHTWASRTNAGNPWNVTLTVTDAAGQTSVQSTTVTFNFGALPTAVVNGPAIVDETFATNGVWSASFNANGSADDFGIWRYEWNIDGSVYTGNPVTFTTTTAGDKTATVRVFDHANQSTPASMNFLVKANALPVARITGPTQLNESAAVNGCWKSQWNSSTSTDDRGIWKVEWDFGDGTPINTAAAPSHDFCAPGTYTVKLTVFDFGRQSHFVTQDVVVAGSSPPVAVITAPITTVEGKQPFPLSGAASTDDFGIIRYDWEFPPRIDTFDGTTINVANWTVSPGATQNDKLFVTGTTAWGNRYFFSNETVGRGTVIEGRIETPGGAAASHAMVGFKNTGTGGNYPDFTHALYFNNGAINVYEDGSHRGQFSTYTKGQAYDFKVESLLPSGAKYYFRPAGAASYTLVYTSGYSSSQFLRHGSPVYSGTWGFDDWKVTAFLGGIQVAGSMGQSGPVKLTVTDNALLTHSTSINITVVTGDPPVAALSGPASGGVGVDLNFSGEGSTDDYEIASYTWDFGDGSTGNGRTVSHFWTTIGPKTVTLTVLDYAGQSSTATHTIQITGQSLVRTVPWQIIGNFEVPHDVISGKPTKLKAVASAAALPVNYTWDFGDGSPTVSGTATTLVQAYGIEAAHTYTGSDGTPFEATISIVDAGGSTSTAKYRVQVRDPALEVEINLAIDEGLWYLHKTQTRTNITPQIRGGNWSEGGFTAAPTSSAVQAFEINGHVPGGDAGRDPYVETVIRGLNFCLTRLASNAIGPQTYGNPDTNGNGIGINMGAGQEIYELGQVMDALVAAGDPNLVAQVGGVNVIGRPFKDLVQDAMDQYYWGQYDDASAGGGWRYNWNTFPDNSACQWAAIGCLAGHVTFGLPIPQWVKDRNIVWLNYSKSTNGFGYTGPGFGHGTTPSGIVQLVMSDVPNTDPLWRNGEDWLAREWTGFMNSRNFYGWYSFAKSMRLARPEPISRLRFNNFPWFLDNTNGMARNLIKIQFADGHWDSAAWVSAHLSTAWGVIILSSTLFQKPPVAIIHASPNPGAVGQNIHLDGSASYHLDPVHSIVTYKWDFDDRDGINFDLPDAVGPVADHAFGALGNYTVTLQVTDDNSPVLTDTSSVQVQITIPPHPPTAVVGGSYVAAVGESIQLDGSASFDIDQDQGDSITAYGWELDGLQPRDFDEATGPNPLVPGFAAAGTYTIGLRVTDNTAAVFPQSGKPNLTDDAFTDVLIYPLIIDDLACRPKDNKIQLTWTPKGGQHYQIWRSEVGPNRGFNKIAVTHSTFSTYLDQGIQLNKRYFYRLVVYHHNENHSEVDPIGASRTCAVTSSPRTRDPNARPKITTLPPTSAFAGQLYSYDVNATDQNGDPITFEVQGPAGMTIDPASGLIQWTPTDAQVGVAQNVFILAKDNKGGEDAQIYDLVVRPRANVVPIAEANGPYGALAGVPISFSSLGSSDPDGDPITYIWTFGDGESSSEPNPVHTYGAAGSYIATLFVQDDRGGVGTDQANVQIDVPNRLPVAVAGPDRNIRLGQNLHVDGSGSFDPDGNPLTYKWNFGDSTDPVFTVEADHLYISEGVFAASLMVDDGAGGMSTDEFFVTVGAVNGTPVATASGPSSGNVDEELIFSAVGTTDPDGDALAFSWDFGDGSTTSGLVVSHRFQIPGNYPVVFTADDGFGGQGQATVNVHINAPPIFQSIPPLSVLEDETFSYLPIVTDADNDPVSLVLAGGPSGMVLDGSGVLSWTPGNGDVGPRPVLLQASDGQGRTTDQAFTLTVINVNDSPVITSTPSLTATEDVLYAYNVLASDPDGDPISFVLDSGPAGMALNSINGQLRWTPTDANLGPNPVSLSAHDGQGGVATQDFTIVVTDVNDAPAIVSAPVLVATEGSLYSYDVDAIDPDDASLMYSLTTAPAGMTVNSATGLIQWTPTTATPAVNPVTVHVTDGRGGNDSQAFSVTVTNVNDDPVFDSTPLKGGIELMLYSYDANATDEEGDTISFSLLAAPAGMAINSASGLVQWTPQAGNQGDHTVTIQASDTNGGHAEQTYTLTIRQANQTPVFTSVAPTAALEDTLYSYDADATDSDGDEITFSLATAPAGMTIDPSTGLINWTPTQSQAGAHPVTVAAMDIFGAQGLQSFNIGVAAVNDSPAIGSSPVTNAEVSIPYVYDVDAGDEENDAITFSLLTAPAGMTINGSTGLIQWTPSAGQLGVHPVAVRAMDPSGDFGDQAFGIMVVDLEHPPVVTSIPGQVVQDPNPFTAISLDNFVSDLDHADNELTWSTTGSSQLTVSINGARVATITYAAGTRVAENITFKATDPDGLSSSTTASFTVAEPSDDKVPPVASISLGSVNIPLGGSTIITVSTQDNEGIGLVTIKLDGVNVSVVDNGDGTYSATVPGSTAGQHTIEVLVQDLAGNQFGDSTDVMVVDPSISSSLTVAITSPAGNSVLKEATDIVGTAAGNSFSDYVLEYAPVGTGDYVEFASGGAPVTGGLLGKFDPTMVEDGIYSIRLTARNLGGQTALTSIVVEADGGTIVGPFTLSFQDKVLLLGSFPLTVTRTYDSRNKVKDDFGIGWRLMLSGPKLTQNIVLGTEWEQLRTGGFIPTYYLQETDEHVVTITFDDNQKFQFRAEPDPSQQTLFPLSILDGMTFEPLEGTRGTLSASPPPDLVSSSAVGPVEILTFDFDVYNPSTYTFNHPDGFTYRFSTKAGSDLSFELRSVTNPDGTTITVTDNGLVRSDGVGIDFIRDGEGRITRIEDPNGGAIRYEYNLRGDLSAFIDEVGNRSEYSYDRRHNLTEMRDPLGNRAIRTEYDENGRMISTTDANGNRYEFTHNIEGREEIVRDRLGNFTRYIYNDRGFLLSEEKSVTIQGVVYPAVRTFTYFADGNVASETDAAGRTATWIYDARGNNISQTDFEGRTAIRTFNARDQILTQTDSEGNLTTNTYDSRGHPLTVVVTNAAGNVVSEKQNVYNAAGNLTEERIKLNSSDTAVTRYEYNSSGSRTAIIDASGNRTSYTYDANGNRLSETTTRTLADGSTQTLITRFEYDAKDRVVKTTDPLGNTTLITYTPRDKRETLTDRNGHVTRYEYDAMGNLTRTIHPDGSAESSTYDAEGHQTSSTDREGFTTRFAYDELGRLVRTTYPDGTPGDPSDNPVARSVYDTVGRTVLKIDERGNETAYTYVQKTAGSPRKEIVEDALGNTTVHEYDGNNNRTRMVDALGRELRFQYDGAKRLVRQTFHDGSFKAIEYDLNGRKIAEIDQAGLRREFRYDLLDRLIEVTDALGGKTSYTYDQLGNQISQTDALGRVIRFEYDGLKRRTARVSPLGQRETYVHDRNGNVLSRTDFNGTTTEYEYDSMNRLVREAYPDGSEITFAYSPGGKRTRVADSYGETMHEYDTRGMLTRQTKPDGTFLAYSYDAAGNKTSVENPSGIALYSFDALNRLSSVEDPNSAVTLYSYDAVGNRTVIRYPNGNVTTHTYDALNRLISVATADAASNPIASYDYDLGLAGNRVQVSEAGSATTGRTVQYTYDSLYRLTKETIDEAGTDQDSEISYQYDTVGNRTERKVVVGNQTTTTTYTFDDNDRLTREVEVVTIARNGDGPSGNGPVAVGFLPVAPSRFLYHSTYAFMVLLAVIAAFWTVQFLVRLNQSGRRGRRKWRRTLAWSSNRFVISILSLVMVLGADKVHAMTYSAQLYASLGEAALGQAGPPTITYTYDNNGSTLARTNGSETDTYTYDYRNRLASAAVEIGSDPGTVSYTYDVDNIRTRKTAGADVTDYLVDHNRDLPQVLVESTSGGSIVSYVYGDDLISMERPASEGGIRYYHYDGQLSARQLSDSSGSISDTYTYEAFGNLLSSTGSTINNYRYTGEQYDANVGFYYLRARYYNTDIGRFHTMDSFEGSIFDPASLHKYLYTNNDPVNNWDPTGLCCSLASVMISVAIVGILTAIVGTIVTGDLISGIKIGINFAAATALLFAAFALGRIALAIALGIIQGGLQVLLDGVDPTATTKKHWLVSFSKGFLSGVASVVASVSGVPSWAASAVISLFTDIVSGLADGNPDWKTIFKNAIISALASWVGSQLAGTVLDEVAERIVGILAGLNFKLIAKDAEAFLQFFQNI